MKRFIFLTFAVLAWIFWELSGGADFEPAPLPARPERVAQADPAPQATPAPQAEPAPQRQPEPAPDPAPAPQREPQAEPALSPETLPDLPASFETPAAEPDPQPDAQPDPDPAAAPPTDPAPAASGGVAPLDIRILDATRVNLRGGPGTDFRAVDQLSQGTVVEVLETDSAGDEPWVRLIVPATGVEGWMAERFLIRQ